MSYLKKNFVWSLLLFFSPLNSFAQLDGDYTFMQKHFQQEICWGLLNEAGNTPVYSNRIYSDQEWSSFYFSFFQVQYEAKLVVKQFADKGSISISVPAGFAFDVADEIGDGMYLNGRSGLFIDGNLGDGSTYNNISKRGVSVGVGVRAILPLLHGKEIEESAFFNPVMRLGYTRTQNYRTTAKTSFYIYFGPGKNIVLNKGEPFESSVQAGLVGGFTIRKHL